jgi:hypothetical protein
MKLLAWLVAASALAFGATCRADDKKDEAVPVAVDQLEKAYGIKVKSVKTTELQKEGKTNITVTLEFTKDVPDVTELKKVLVTYPGGQLPKGTMIDSVPLVFHIFDKDNVSLGKHLIWAIEGDLSGVKGDAFRAVLVLPAGSYKQAAKLEARLKVTAK